MAQKKTREEYVSELKIKNPTTILIGEYMGATHKTMHRCLLHNIDWEIAPTNALKGNGCIKCWKERKSKSLQKTHEQYVNEVSNINPNIIVMEKYINAKTPILHKCIIHNIEWKPYPEAILRGSGCPECGKEKIHNSLGWTHEQYIEELKIVNQNIVVLGVYVNTITPILHKCLIDGYEWFVQPNVLLHGCGCPKCAGNLRLTTQEYIEKLKIINPDIIPIEEYITSKTKIMHKCLIDGYEWKIEPSSTLQGVGCPKCAGNAKLTQDEYVYRVLLINPDIEVIGQYIGRFTPILHKCRIDGFEWMASPSNILYGRGCPQCQESSGERRVRQWLSNHNISYIYQKTFDDCKYKKTLPFDFYLPDYDIAIEYDGEQHYKPIKCFGGEEKFKKTIERDKIKNDYCECNNIRLLRIPYYANTEEELNNFLFI